VTAPRVAVIGGGLAGLAAAARLRQLGAMPVVFERESAVGGVVRTVQRDGWTFDLGPAVAAEPAAAVRDMLDASGLGECTIRSSAAGATRYIVVAGKPVILPRTTSEFSASSLLSLGGRLRLLKERFIPARGDLGDESVESFARRRYGDEMAERLFDPLIASTCAGDPAQIIARYAFPALVGHESRSGSTLQGSARARMEERRRRKGRSTGSWSCHDGMQQLPVQLARTIGSVRVDTTVERVGANADGATVTVAGEAAEQFAGAVLAVPAPSLAGMMMDLTGAEGMTRIAALPHASIGVVSLGYRSSQVGHPCAASRLLVPSVERRSILSAVFPSALFAGRAPEGHTLVTAFVGGARQAELLRQPEDALSQLVARDLAALLDINGDPVVRSVTVWRDVLPQAVAGHGARLAAADAIEQANPRLAFAGAWHDGLAIGEVLHGGMRAADRLMARLPGMPLP
jgi:protoporphyrinogen/coproporphyrinogen III oxidase